MKRYLGVACLACAILIGCGGEQTAPSGIKEQKIALAAGSDGMSVEQRNVAARLKEDNTVGEIKHLYVISAYSGQVILYSTVAGKVTSSGKSLTSKLCRSWEGNSESSVVDRIGDDGTYGGSVEYIYWWDTKGIYHQHYVSGGQIVHVSSQPIAVKSVIINLSGAE